jgi:hypothetical protein
MKTIFQSGSASSNTKNRWPDNNYHYNTFINEKPIPSDHALFKKKKKSKTNNTGKTFSFKSKNYGKPGDTSDSQVAVAFQEAILPYKSDT